MTKTAVLCNSAAMPNVTSGPRLVAHEHADRHKRAVAVSRMLEISLGELIRRAVRQFVEAEEEKAASLLRQRRESEGQ